MLAGYRLLFGAWPGEDMYRAYHDGRGYFGSNVRSAGLIGF